MKKLRIKNTKGRITRYGFACGYIESKEIGCNTICKIYMEHNVYHVKAYCHGIGQLMFWDTFRTLTEARKRYDMEK